MSVEPGQTYECKTRGMIILVLNVTERSTRCLVVWSKPDRVTGYRVGEVSTWDKISLDFNWRRLD